jgi:hypothetical protein
LVKELNQKVHSFPGGWPVLAGSLVRVSLIVVVAGKFLVADRSSSEIAGSLVLRARKSRSLL